MPTPRSPAAFLKAARAALTATAAQRPKPLTIVVGNQSADLDSICSAVLLAYFRSHTPPHSGTLHVPLANLPRDDLKLHPELEIALRGPALAFGPPADSLITLSELPDDLSAADTRWLLVDHNALTGDLGRRFAGSVVGCIDHHVDEGVVPQPDGGEKGPRIIEKAGSCASLVVNHAAAAWDALAEQDFDAQADNTLAHMALAPILVDTASLKSADKTVEADRRAAAFAESFLLVPELDVMFRHVPGQRRLVSCGDPDYNRTAFFDELSLSKNDISRLDYSEVLRKDYKQWSETPSSASSGGETLTLGMSTVTQGMAYMLAVTGDASMLLAALQSRAREHRLDIAAVMTVQHDKGGFARQLLLCAFTPQGAKAAQAFVRANREALGLEPWTDSHLDSTADASGGWLTCWAQRRTEFSRKQVAPLLREAMRSS